MSIGHQMAASCDTTILWANAYEEKKGAPVWEQALVTLWFLATYIPIPLESPIRYMLCMFFLVLFMIHKADAIPVLFKAWPLLLVPALGMISILWSPMPSAAFRTAILYILSVLIVVVMVTRMDARTILRCLMFAGMIAVVISAPYYSLMYWGGPYLGAKNYFAQQMLFAGLLSLMAILNERELPWVRLLAVPFFFIAMLFMIRGDSATALIYGVVGCAGLLFIRLFWIEAAGIRHLRMLLVLAMSALLLTVVMYVLNQSFNNYVNELLGMLGKDRTFTGRTMIWKAGEAEAAKHPMFGVGLEGFWQDWKGAAQSINEHDYKPYGTKLTFHNAYLEVQVHLGYVGMALYIFMLAWAGYRLVAQWLRNSSIETSALLVFGGIVFISTFTESYAWGLFNTPVNLLYIGALADFSPIRKKFMGRVPVQIGPNNRLLRV